MKRLLWAVAVLVAGSVVGHTAIEDQTLFASKDQILFASQDCSSVIGQEQDGNTFVLYTDQFHWAEYIPAKKVVHIDAETLRYDGTTYKLLTDKNSSEICG